MSIFIKEDYQLFAQEKIKFDNFQNTVKYFELLLRNKRRIPEYPVDLIGDLLNCENEYRAFIYWMETEIVSCLKKSDHYCVSMNVSVNQLRNLETLNFFKRLKKYNQRVTIEINEECIIVEKGINNQNRVEISKRVIDEIAVLVNLGYSISVDDVGSGQNSLENVTKLLPYIKEIKFSLINFRKLELDEKIILNFLYSWKLFADRYGLDFVVEGVESKKEVEYLIKKGVTYFQGYYFNKPFSLLKM